MRKYIPILLLLSLLFHGASVAKTPASTNDLTAKSWLVTDSEGNLIAGENVHAVRSIASVTKLMTVLTVLDRHAELDRPLDLTMRNYNKKTRKAKRSAYDNLTRRQLIDLAMIRSDNNAARLLCETYPEGYKKCIDDMNAKAHSLGMLYSVFYDPTGLDDRNNSTAADLVKLARSAVNYPEVVNASQQSQIKVKIKRHWFAGNNTNPLIGNTHDIKVSKTGWTTRAGGCILMLMDTDKGRRIVVVLGSKSIKTRIPEAEFISKINETAVVEKEPNTLFGIKLFGSD
jgi:D-alanyl-D-alanine endopeptidase (penicillin-binding protein 7)